jgi:macrolide transport system ATP-binding/permease protein
MTSQPLNSIISLKNIRKSFPLAGERVQILKGISLTVEVGDFIAIMGPSGSGKSTLMNILGLLDVPDSGSFVLNGEEISGLSSNALATARRTTLGFVFQQFNLLPRMTAAENVALPLLYSIRAMPLEPAKEILTRVGLQHRVDHTPTQLSGGQQQRVAIARALMNRPKIILADEPTGNLDSKSSVEIMELLHELNREGITIILVTHEPDVAKEANRIISIRDGEISDDIRTRDIEKKVHREISTGHHLEIHRARSEYYELFKQAFRTLFANPLRTILSTLGVLIGVAAVIAMLAVGKGATESIENQLSSLGSNLLSVRSANVRVGGVAGSTARLRLALEDADTILKNVSNVKSTSSFVQEGGKYVQYEDKNWSTMVYGVMPGYLHMHASDPDQGRIFSDEENSDRSLVALLGVTVSRQLFGTLNPIGQQLKINKIPFQIIGILPEKGGSGPMDQDDRVMVPINTAMYRLFGQSFVDAIEVEMKKGADMDAAQIEIDHALRARHNIPLSMKDEAFRIFNMADLQQALTSTSKTLALLLLSVAGISLLVGGIGIMNIMLVSVTERTKEIGLRKALGGTASDILLQFLVEAAAIGIFGGMLGAALGTFVSIMVNVISGWATSVSTVSVVGSFLFASLVGMVFGIWPANRAAKLSPIDALRGD